MLFHYDWLASNGEPPRTGTWLDVSGDPDRLVLRGVVARHADAEDGVTTLSIHLDDGQAGSDEFQVWAAQVGDVGIMVSENQRGIPHL